MTTIAVRGRVMASDSVESDDDCVVDDRCKKIWRLPDGSIFGAAKCSEDGMRLYQAMRRKQPPPKLDDVVALLLKPDGTLWLYEGTIWQRIKQKYYAIGSGAKFALGAMDAGGNAIKAALIGARRDPYSGGRIQVLRLR